MGEVRIGFVSSYDTETGTAKIYYPDRCHEVTDNLPVFSPFGLLQSFKKNDTVLVLHLSNGQEAGILIGTYSSDGDVPVAGIANDNGNLILKDASGSIALKEIIAKCRE